MKIARTVLLSLNPIIELYVILIATFIIQADKQNATKQRAIVRTPPSNKQLNNTHHLISNQEQPKETKRNQP
jgi:hypothetical protein